MSRTLRTILEYWTGDLPKDTEGCISLPFDVEGFCREMDGRLATSADAHEHVKTMMRDETRLRRELNVQDQVIRDLTKERDELKAANARLKAENWVLRDSQLRTYDGLTTRHDAYRAALEQLQAMWAGNNEAPAARIINEALEHR